MFLVLFSKLVMGLEWGRSFAALIIIMSMFIIAVTALGIFMATFVKTNAQLSAVSSIIITCSTMVAGCYWPIEVQPVFMQKIAVIFPQYWAMKGMRNVIENNMGIQSVIIPASALAVMGIIFFAGSVLKGRFGIKARKPLLH
jgi:ABC-2 type transport system permease protein